MSEKRQTTTEAIDTHPNRKADLKKTTYRVIAAVALLASSGLGFSRDNKQPNYFIANHRKSTPADNQMTVASANVHSWLSPGGENNFEQFEEGLEDIEAETVCLQEVVDGPEVRKLVGEYNVIFAATKVDLKGRRFGNLLLSTSRLELESIISLPNPETNEPRNAIVAHLQTEKGTVRVSCTHLSTDWMEAVTQIQSFENAVENPVDLNLGDMNMEEPIYSSGRIGRSSHTGRFMQYSAANAAVLSFPDYSHIKPEKHIDWILTSCAGPIELREVQETTVVTSVDSDHKMVSVVFPVDLCLPR